ncbi:MAG: tRNA (N6-threonylcarbamoyladenosine(37)-N6)-methyltransferase TrmO [Luteolibacter sp.]
MRMNIEPIATLRTCFGSKFATPRQPGLCPSAWGELIFHPPYRSMEAVRGLEGFSHLWLVFGFHETVDQGWKPTVRPPRLGGNERVGVFASRSTFRPNGLGFSLVALEGIDTTSPNHPIVKLGGVDLIDGTPIYDIKPYLPYAEALPHARAGFAEDEIPRLKVEVDDAAQPAFKKLSERAQKLIVEALSLDPRPAVQTQQQDRSFGANLCGKNIRFFIREGECLIIEISDITPQY